MTDGLDTHSTNLSAVPGLAPQGDSPAPSTDGSGAVCGGGSIGASVQPANFRFPALAGRKRRQRVGGTFFAAGDAERELLAKQLSLLVTAEEVEAIMRQVRGESDGAGESLASGIDGADAASEEGRGQGDSMAVSTEAADIDSGNAIAIPPSSEAADLLSATVARKTDAVSKEKERVINKNAFEEPIRCPIPGCHVVVQGALALDAHHQAMHRAMCATCSKAFPSNRLLNIHVAEAHDSFFQAKVARGVAMYECLVETCTHRFPSDAVRQQHLVDRHHYPPSFHFHSLSHSHPSQRRRRQMAQHKGEGAGREGGMGGGERGRGRGGRGGRGRGRVGGRGVAGMEMDGEGEGGGEGRGGEGNGGLGEGGMEVESEESVNKAVGGGVAYVSVRRGACSNAGGTGDADGMGGAAGTVETASIAGTVKASDVLNVVPGGDGTPTTLLRSPFPQTPLNPFPLPSPPLFPAVCPFRLSLLRPSLRRRLARPRAAMAAAKQPRRQRAAGRCLSPARLSKWRNFIGSLRPSIVVAKDGSGNYRTISEAMAAAPKGAVIYVRAGVYEEQVRVRQDRVVLVGEGHARTVIRAGRNQAEGTPLMDTATLSACSGFRPAWGACVDGATRAWGAWRHGLLNELLLAVLAITICWPCRYPQ
ncbi:unnamed protein product [Closterium sp. Naga37s-1]|nr:unnamed protein product [Closterium sp. Naga37s-1]